MYRRSSKQACDLYYDCMLSYKGKTLADVIEPPRVNWYISLLFGYIWLFSYYLAVIFIMLNPRLRMILMLQGIPYAQAVYETHIAG